jgi:hypothetical protein
MVMMMQGAHMKEKILQVLNEMQWFEPKIREVCEGVAKIRGLIGDLLCYDLDFDKNEVLVTYAYEYQSCDEIDRQYARFPFSYLWEDYETLEQARIAEEIRQQLERQEARKRERDAMLEKFDREQYRRLKEKFGESNCGGPRDEN